MDFSVLLKGGVGGTKSGKNLEISVEQKLKEMHPETAPPGNQSHIQLPNPDITADAIKCIVPGD